MSKPLFEKSNALQAHLLKTRMLQFEVQVGLAGEYVEGNIGTVNITGAAAGESTVELLAADLGELQAVKTVEIVDADGATVTATGSIDVDGNLEIALDSDTDYTAADDVLQIRVVYKLK